MTPGETSELPLHPVPLYDALAEDYDRFVNWQARLSHELPFLERVFAGHGVSRALDVACGTGHHVIALAQRGYDVAGADLSTAMVERARQNAAAAGLDIRFDVAGLGELADAAPIIHGAPWDAVLCLGNSLPHLLAAPAVAQALTDMANLLRPGGLLLIQNRNFDRIWARRERFMEPQSYSGPDGERIFVRFYDFHPERITFNMICLRPGEEGWVQGVEATDLRPILGRDLASVLEAAGFRDVTFYGGFDGSPFDPDGSGDLVALAVRG